MPDNGSGTALVQRAERTAQSVSAFSGEKEAFNTAQRIAHALSASDIVPADYRGKLPNVLVAMEYAHRLGASVLAVMQNLDVIHGRPGLRASFLIGTVNASGRFSPIRYRWQGEEGTDSWGCRAVATDRESGEECLGPLITIRLAKAEDWYGKKGSKWKTIPELMMMYRAGAWWTRVYCPELSLGLHTTDEMSDIGPSPMARVEAATAALDGPDNGPPQVGSVRDIPPPPEDPDAPATEGEIAQLQNLMAKASEAGLLEQKDAEEMELAIHDEHGPGVRQSILELTRSLAGTVSGQASLLDEES